MFSRLCLYISLFGVEEPKIDGKMLVTLPFKAIQICALVVLLFVMGIGIARFPDAPYSQREHGFFGKNGQPHSAEEFHHYQSWEQICSIAGLMWAVVCIWGAFSSLERRRRTRGQEKGQS